MYTNDIPVILTKDFFSFFYYIIFVMLNLLNIINTRRAYLLLFFENSGYTTCFGNFEFDTTT
jgi:hypothetical protein